MRIPISLVIILALWAALGAALWADLAQASPLTGCQTTSGAIVKTKMGARPLRRCAPTERQITFEALSVRPSAWERRRGMTMNGQRTTREFRVSVPDTWPYLDYTVIAEVTGGTLLATCYADSTSSNETPGTTLVVVIEYAIEAALPGGYVSGREGELPVGVPTNVRTAGAQYENEIDKAVRIVQPFVFYGGDQSEIYVEQVVAVIGRPEGALCSTTGTVTERDGTGPTS